jgi:hypothetical protein
MPQQPFMLASGSSAEPALGAVRGLIWLTEGHKSWKGHISPSDAL